MPQDRFIFMDNWYVPIEEHSEDADIQALLREFGVAEIVRMTHGRSTDLENRAIHGTDEDRVLYGNGELRYLITK